MSGLRSGSRGNFSVANCGATCTSLICLSCSTLSIHCYFNKRIHAGVVSHLAPIQHLCGSSSVLLCGWFSQPLTGGSLWTSEHIRRQTQEPSALIMSDWSVHGHEIHSSPPFSLSLSLSLSLSPSLSFSLCLLLFHSLTHRAHTHFTNKEKIGLKILWILGRHFSGGHTQIYWRNFKCAKCAKCSQERNLHASTSHCKRKY